MSTDATIRIVPCYEGGILRRPALDGTPTNQLIQHACLVYGDCNAMAAPNSIIMPTVSGVASLCALRSTNCKEK